MVSRTENEYGSSFAKCQGSGVSKSSPSGISRRKWSPGQATLFRRKKVEGEASLSDSFHALKIPNVHDGTDADDEGSDYLTKSLESIEQSGAKNRRSSSKGRKKRSGRKPISLVTKNEERVVSNWWDNSPRDVPSPPSPGRRKASISNMSLRSNSDHSRSRSKEPSELRRSSRSRASRSKSGSRTKSRDRSRSGPKMAQKDLSIEMQQRLYRVTDPNNSIKTRVELEVEFTKGTPAEKRIYREFKNNFDRKEFLNQKDSDEQQRQAEIETNAREESLKETAFLKEVERKHQKERKLVEEAKERERKALDDAYMHSVKTIADGMSTIKDKALEMATESVARNQYKKKSYEKERNQRVESFRRKEGKGMHGVQRALKEAMIEQEDPEEKRMKLNGARAW